MEKRKTKRRHLLLAAAGSMALLGIGLFCYHMVKSTIIENEQNSLLSLARISAQSLTTSFQAKTNLIYGAFSGDMDGEEEISQNLLKVGGRGRYISRDAVTDLQQWEKTACEDAGKNPGKVITGPIEPLSTGGYGMYMTKAVYMKGSIAGYIQMELDLDEMYDEGQGIGIVKNSAGEIVMPGKTEEENVKFTLPEDKKSGCFVEWVYEGVEGVPQKVRKLVAVDTVSVGEEQLTLCIMKNYEEVTKPIESISLSFFLIGGILLTWMGRFLYKIINQQKEEEQLVKELAYEKELNAALSNQEGLMQKYNHSKTIGVLTGAIAHEFNNLMTPIILYTNLLEENEIVYSQVPEEIEELKSSAERCGELAGQLLSYARLGRAEKVLVDYNATYAVRESIHIVERLLPEHVNLKTTICDTSYYIRGQAGALNQIIINLTSNAIHAMKEKGVLTIQFGLSVEDERMLRLIIKDTGCGIAHEIRARIFEPFFTTKGDKQGTGIGLTVVKRLVEEHGGYIRVEASERQGTMFVIDIPSVQERRASEIVEENGVCRESIPRKLE